LNRPYKSTSLDDLIIICSNVPDRDVLKAILTELSHRQTKQARKLEAILVQHLAKQSGDNTVNFLETAGRKNQPNLTDNIEPTDTSGEIKGGGRNNPRWNTNPKQSKHPLKEEQQTAATEFMSGDSLKVTAFAGAGKTSTLTEVTNVRDDPYLAINRAIADEASIEMRGATEPKQKFEKSRSRTAQSKVSRKRYKPGAEWVSWKQVLLKTAVYICGLFIVAAIIGYSYFLYSDWIQTATNLDEYQESRETYNKVQKGLEAPDKVDLAQDFQKGLDAPDKVDLVQDIQRGLDAPDKVDLAQDIQNGLEAYKKGDYPTAIREFRALSEQGNADAQYNLGLLFDKGHGVREDYEEAAKWYRKAAEQGNAEAQLILGINYYEGEDVLEDYKEAAKWYRKSAEQGNSDAQNRLGFMYEKGYGVVQDYSVAAKWYRKSAEQGNANAQKNLSARYFLGQGVIQDNVYSHMWANIAVSQGHKTAIKIGDLVAKKMTASDISRAQELARECVRKNYKEC
jgi:TPR repeat protein